MREFELRFPWVEFIYFALHTHVSMLCYFLLFERYRNSISFQSFQLSFDFQRYVTLCDVMSLGAQALQFLPCMLNHIFLLALVQSLQHIERGIFIPYNIFLSIYLIPNFVHLQKNYLRSSLLIGQGSGFHYDPSKHLKPRPRTHYWNDRTTLKQIRTAGQYVDGPKDS